ncbi:hypothetical protein OOT46_16870 [Aquabacterium sp. A7-Y]|uniref:hypothetical protein n=1 Tax=Aquabacterium sp. A7-Y TaxID=1349605 RepID=UPI00223D584D|nr:hypothetical protein [Aquabacterium sp. A7-Y]MCW7539517.1 hypothetical protein [Aquabacterium sp. A7-Y]
MTRYAPHRHARRLLLASLALCGVAAFAQVGSGLPVRNLLVEVRQGDAAQLSQQSLGGAGGVSVSTSRRVEGGVTVTTTRRETSRSGQLGQQVMVLNGGRAGIRLSQSRPLQFYQVAWSAREGAVLQPSTLIVEAGRGFSVLPRWPGGDAPVQVEIEAESARLDEAGGGVREGSSTRTTLQLPLGEWVTIASSGEDEQSREQGLLSSRDARGSRHVQVQMRVSAP